MTSLKVRFHDNFIKDLMGIDNNDGTKRINSIIGFYVFATSSKNGDGYTDENDYSIVYRGRAEFVNVDNKSDKLITNIFTDESPQLNQGTNLRKLTYIYQVLHDGEHPTIVDDHMIELDQTKFYDGSDNKLCYDTINEYINNPKKIDGYDPNKFRIAFEIYGDMDNKTEYVERDDNGNIKKIKDENNVERELPKKDGDYIGNRNTLSQFFNDYSIGFRPIIDIHSLRILVNLISITTKKNSSFHVHDLGILKDSTIATTTVNDPSYKDYAINSLIEFKNTNKAFSLAPVDVCYEDWNLISLNI